MESKAEFENIAKSIKLIQDDTIQVVVPYGRKGKAGIKYLEKYCRKFGNKPLPGRIRKKLVGVSVHVYKNQLLKHKSQGSVNEFKNGMHIWTGQYDEKLGCVTPKAEDCIV